ncbi:MAG: tetratricopeptide repeat protein, partial [Acidobacteria bacterium]|nr:tetratricopeptide repeat protein [Candidatus Sulfomarinibacter sp. MAG AM1]
MTRITLCLGSVALTLLLLAPLGALAQQVTPSEESGNEAYRNGSFANAIELFTRALSETEDANHRARLQVQIAWTLFALGNEAEVETHLRAALVEDPSLALDDSYYSQDFLDLFDLASRATFDASSSGGTAPAPDLEATIASITDRVDSGADLEGALADVDRLLAAYPRDGRLIPLKIKILGLLGRNDEATSLSLSRGADPGTQVLDDGHSVPDLILRANRLLEEGDATTALELLRQAVNRAPSNSYALELMAEAAMQTADWQSAEFALKSALGLQPDNIGLKLRLGEVYVATFEASAARDIFKSLTEKYPTSDRAWASLGLLEARLHNNDRALAALTHALAENPMLPEVQLAKGELLLLEGDIDGALESFEAAEKLIPDDPQLEARLGQALLSKGRNAEGLGHLQTAVAAGFDSPNVQRWLALALALNESYSESKRVLNAVEPDADGAREIVAGYLELRRERYSEAEVTLRAVANARPGDPAAVNLLAATIYPQNRFSESVTLLSHAYELDPNDGTIESNLTKASSCSASSYSSLTRSSALRTAMKL